ncbi:MAG: hypothetical protein K0R64_2542 [Novosphingobium lindaniclasticum]|jgi:hypothetical protein|uniref:hypothetical protein n=1 Tax=Novosphingobium lindaniclasticum TaxID=1329895 RepID=UPI00240A8043|nr:hypothetical protein [Novosphingobium lindaniclasticum]MDF2639558.1 hypothetical protein [Novosphingobium lindaniclasticum]
MMPAALLVAVSQQARRFAGKCAVFCGLGLIAFGPEAAAAGTRREARLVSCEKADCLLVTGSRADPGMIVRINGHPVRAEGRRNWKVLLPVSTVREWSLPGARSIAVSATGLGNRDEDTRQVKLPIGMLGSITELASLVIPRH